MTLISPSITTCLYTSPLDFLTVPRIVNDCLYIAYRTGNCNDTLNKLQNDLTSGIFKDKISHALYETARFGRQQGGANPQESFQVYISEYIPFFNETTTPCNDYSWGWWSSDHKLTQDLRKRMNSLTTQVNSVIQDAANGMERLGVIFVSGIASQYISGGHQFCAPGHDTDKYMIDKDTWFWSQYLPTGSDTEGPDASITDSTFNSTVKQLVLDFAYGKGNTTPEAYPSSPFFNDTTLSPYNSFDDLLNAMIASPVAGYAPASLEVKRSMHPKGTAFGLHKDAFMAAIASNRGAGTASQTSGASPSAPSATLPPPSTPPPAADQCGDWYKFLFDSFQIYGKNFVPSEIGTDGSGLEKQLSGCGDLTAWQFKNVTGDPHGYQWYASGNLPIGTKACVGRAVVSAGGASPDGCTGAG